MNLRHAYLPALILGTLLACGGGWQLLATSGPGHGHGPGLHRSHHRRLPAQEERRLSTPTHLVLEVWGPATTAGSGLTVTFALGGTAATWRNVKASDAASTYVANGTAFNLGSGAPILKAKLTGTTLVATVAEKGTASPKAINQALLQVALDLQAGATVGASSTLTPDPAKCQILLGDGSMPAIAVTASPITAQ